MTPAHLPVTGRRAGVYGVLDGRRGGMTPPPLPMKGRDNGVYGFLDGNRESSGDVGYTSGVCTEGLAYENWGYGLRLPLRGAAGLRPAEG